MKRVITVRSRDVKIVATITDKANVFTRNEVQFIRDVLADRLQEAASYLPYLRSPLSEVRVK